MKFKGCTTVRKNTFLEILSKERWEAETPRFLLLVYTTLLMVSLVICSLRQLLVFHVGLLPEWCCQGIIAQDWLQ